MPLTTAGDPTSTPALLPSLSGRSGWTEWTSITRSRPTAAKTPLVRGGSCQHAVPVQCHGWHVYIGPVQNCGHLLLSCHVIVPQRHTHKPPLTASCSASAGRVISCNTDAPYIQAVEQLRMALPRPYIISVAPFSVGAYGQGAYLSARPSSDYTGVAVNMLRRVGGLVRSLRAWLGGRLQ